MLLRRSLTVLMVAVAVALPLAAQETRTHLDFPDLPGYTTLKCDFHMHTVFSDGEVFPPVRVREAWRDGLDVIAITEHVEHQVRVGDITKSNLNKSYELAEREAAQRHIILIRGVEISRSEPHGHFNAVGIVDCNPLNHEENAEAIRLAIDQGGFVFWNHPPNRDLSDPEQAGPQRDYLEKGWMHGIEVFNGTRYYPHALRWCLENDLTMMSNTDVHGLIVERYDLQNGEHRAMTLVFAEERSEKSVLDALRDRRTVCFAQNMLVGREELLKPLVQGCLEVVQANAVLPKRRDFLLEIRNNCPVTFELEADGGNDEVKYPSSVTLPAYKTVFLRVEAGANAPYGSTKQVSLPYTVKNALVAPDEGLKITLDIAAEFPG